MTQAIPDFDSLPLGSYQTALYRAVQTGNEELVSLILDTKVDVELGRRTIEHCSEDDRRKLEKKNKPTSWITEETPLQHACPGFPN